MDGARGARRSLVAGGLLLAAMSASALLAPWLATDRPWLARERGRLSVLPPAGAADEPLVRAPVPFDPLAVDITRSLEPPSRRHPLGTDALGRDLLSRMLHGARRSLAAGLLATALALAVALFLGAAAGMAPAGLDEALARVADVVNAFPALVGAVALLGGAGGLVAGLAEPVQVAVVVGLFTWPALFRYVRAEVRRVASGEVALSALAAGAGPARVAARHLLPLALTPVLVPAAFVAGGTVLAEAGLGFLGLGIRPPEPSWGNLLRDGMAELRSAWWLTAFPGLAVFATVLAFQLLADGLRRRAGGPA